MKSMCGVNMDKWECKDIMNMLWLKEHVLHLSQANGTDMFYEGMRQCAEKSITV